MLLDWPDLDLSLPVSATRPDGRSAREAIFGGGGWVRPKLREMIEARGL